MSQGYAGAEARTGDRQSLSEDASRLIGRLSEVKVRLFGIHDRLFGSEPRPAASERTNDAPAPNITQYHINTTHQLSSDIESILTRIENKL